MNKQPVLGTRARRDPLRRTGNANAVAAGVDLTQVGVVSETELMWIRRLANETVGELDAYLRKEEERRKALSAARTANWTDTKEAKHGEFIRSQAAAAEEAERRKEELDALFAEQEREAHRSRVAQLELKLLKEDPRGRNIQHMLALHDAIKGREEQIAFTKSKYADELEQEKADLAEMQRKAWGEEAEERRKQLEQRQRNIAEKTTNLDAVMYQLEERKKLRAEEKAERVYVDMEALDEKRENEEEERTRKEKERENGLWNKEHARKAVSKHEKLDARVAQFKLDEADRIRDEAFMDSIQKVVEEKRKKKQADFEKAKELGFKAYLAEAGQPSPIYRTQDIFERRGVNFANTLAEANDQRQAQAKENMLNAKNFENDTHRKAEASPSGFVSMEEEMEYLEEMRALPAKVRAEEAEKAAQRRREADRIARIQKMQAAEKRTHERILVEKDRENTRLQREKMEANDARYMQYLKSQLPDDMDPYLRDKALHLS